MTAEDFCTPRRAKRNFLILKNTIEIQRKKIQRKKNCSLQTTVSTLRTLNGLLKLLKDKSYITESSESMLRASLPDSSIEVFERMLKGQTTQKYSSALRSFALTLSFYSPRAYNFVRNTFNRCLPHPTTITKWYRSVDGTPGFSQEALNALKIIQQEAAAKQKTVLCNMVLDEMSIRQQVE